MANKWHPQNGLTLYGRKPALEALANQTLEIAQLHLADSNRPGGIIAQIIAQAESRNIPIPVPRKAGIIAYLEKRAPRPRRGTGHQLPPFWLSRLTGIG